MFMNERADIYLENISDGIKNVTFLKWCAVQIDSFWWACFWFLLLLLSLLLLYYIFYYYFYLFFFSDV